MGRRQLSTRNGGSADRRDRKPPPGGKRRLIDAAVRLGAPARGITALGLRQLAREARLNPNTYYRHFKSLDELGLAIIDELAEPLRRSLRDARRMGAVVDQPARPLAVIVRSTYRFFDFVEEHPGALLISVRELHGASPVLRRALARMLEDFSADLVEDIQELELLPAVDQRTLAELATFIIRQLFFWSLDYLEAPTRRSDTRERAVRYIYAVSLGAAMLQPAATTSPAGARRSSPRPPRRRARTAVGSETDAVLAVTRNLPPPGGRPRRR